MAVRDLPSDRLPAADERVSQGNMHLAALAVLTAVAGYLCYRLAVPFLPALAWALALAVITYPMHAWIRRRLKYENLSAAVSVLLVVLIIVIPALVVAAEMAREAGSAGQLIQEHVKSGRLREAALGLPYGDQIVPWVEGNVDFRNVAEQMTAFVSRDTALLLRGSVWAVLEVLVGLFVLFFCFRDRDRLLRGVRALIPLPYAETQEALRRVADSIHATVYGTVVTAVIQGVTGGLLFWAVGLPAPVLWGVVMFILGVLPMVGAILVWAPATVLLVAEGAYPQAIAVLIWGILMSGPVGDYLYAYLTAGRMRMHPVPALIAYLGGLSVFGITGMVLGPAILAVAYELLEVWRRRAVPAAPEPAAATAEPAALVEGNGRTDAVSV
jgi:predicted PurR-regulated permease PerM